MVVNLTEAQAKRLGVTFTGDDSDLSETIDGLKKQVKDLKKEFEDYEKGTKEGSKEVSKSVKETEKSVESLTDKFKKLATLAAVFGVLRKSMEFFKEAATAGLEMTQSMFTLEVAIRGLQRIGLDTTIAGWKSRLVDLKKEFPIFSKKEFVDAASLAALMTREFGFTEAQIANVVRQSVILAQVTGNELTESVRGVTYAIGSGYFESLQRAGINISRQIIAEEALRRGYEGSYTALSQNIRAMITYEIVQQNLNAISEDASRIVETTAGQVRRLNASYEDLIMTLGLIITSSDSAKESVGGLASVIEWINDVLTIWSNINVSEVFDFTPLFGSFGMLGQSIQQWVGYWGEAREELEDSESTLAKIYAWLLKIGLLKAPEDILGDTDVFFGGAKVPNQERYDELAEGLTESIEKIAEIEKEGEEKREDIKEEWRKTAVDNYEKHLQKMVDLQNDYDQKLSDIGLKETRALADEEIDYAYKVAEAARQASFRKEEAERRYREREINAEKRFQEKMRQLRENFLLNLEDAVRERDALQIIRLTRQYNLRKTQMEREEGLSGSERTRAFQEQLRQIEQQRLERQRQLALEHQRREQDIARQAARERAKAQLDFERRQDDERTRRDEAATEKREKFDEDMLELDAQIQERINKVVDGLREELNLSETELKQIGKLYTAYYGPDSEFDAAIGYAMARLHQLQLMHARLRVLLGTTGSGWGGPMDAPDMAEGGTIIANKPTTVTFGEAGAEIATFTPLNRAGVNTNQVTGSLPAGMGGGGGGGKYVVGISLSPGLEGKIVDQALGQASDIIFKLERARR